MLLCHVCNLPPKNLYQYERHFKVHSNSHNLHLPCVHGHCMRDFSSFNALRVHVTKRHRKDDQVEYPHEEKEYTCPQSFCSIKCWNRKAMSQHVKRHIDPGLMTACFVDECKVMFKNSKTFSAHMSRHHRYQICAPSLSSSQHDDTNPDIGMEVTDSTCSTSRLTGEQECLSSVPPNEMMEVTRNLALFFF